MKYICEGFF